VLQPKRKATNAAQGSWSSSKKRNSAPLQQPHPLNSIDEPILTPREAIIISNDSKDSTGAEYVPSQPEEATAQFLAMPLKQDRRVHNSNTHNEQEGAQQAKIAQQKRFKRKSAVMLVEASKPEIEHELVRTPRCVDVVLRRHPLESGLPQLMQQYVRMPEIATVIATCVSVRVSVRVLAHCQSLCLYSVLLCPF
jgi:hypothetical protein